MLKEGTFLGDRYEIIKQIGSGGMSDVYKAKCHKLNRFVAIKVLKQEYSEDKNFLMKFNVEAQSVAGLTHPNIVNIYDVGSDNGLSYIVMEYIEGITLKKYIEKKGRLGVKEAVSIAIQVAQGIEAAHNNQIIHRDIKPQNILISKDGKVKVTDFGIARAASANTINSNAMGSAHYISPEQARGGFVDEKSDIYSLGITLFEMITGRVPFEGDSTVTIALKHIQDELPSIDDFVDDIPVSVKKIVEKCTQKKPDRRYLKISSLIADLKKSLISPDEDFVQLIPINNTSSTVMISDDEVSAIKEGKKDDDSLELTDDDDEAEEESLDEVNPKLDKIITIGAIVAGVVILIIFILLCIKFLGGIDGCSSGKNKEQTTETSEMVTVPDLTGMTEDEATETLNDLGLGIKTAYEQNNDVEEGKVISQSVDADSQVAKNTTITVTISQGKADVTVPDLVGKTKDEAIAALKDSHLNYTIVTDYNDAAIDIVFQTNPGAGGTLKYGDSVELHVSRGPQSTKVSVPDLKGKTQAQAKAALEAVGLKIGEVTTVNSSEAGGTVIAQGYEANTTIEKGSSVSITLSSGTNIVSKKTKDFKASDIKEIYSSIEEGTWFDFNIYVNNKSVYHTTLKYTDSVAISSQSFDVDDTITKYTVEISINNGQQKTSKEYSFN